VPQHAAGGEFGGGGGLADTGRPDQRVDATTVDDIALAVDGQQASIGTSLDPGQRLCGIEIARQIGKQVAGELWRKAGVEQLAKNLGLHRLGARRFAPGETGQMLLDTFFARSESRRSRPPERLLLSPAAHWRHCSRQIDLRPGAHRQRRRCRRRQGGTLRG
jgi:hypothetical protein